MGVKSNVFNLKIEFEDDYLATNFSIICLTLFITLLSINEIKQIRINLNNKYLNYLFLLFESG